MLSRGSMGKLKTFIFLKEPERVSNERSKVDFELKDLGSIGENLIKEIKKILKSGNGARNMVAKSFEEIEDLEPLQAFFLAISLMTFLENDGRVLNELLDQAFIAADLITEEETLH